MNSRATRPKCGLLALTLEFYEQFAPSLRPGREAWLKDHLLPALARSMDVEFSCAMWKREQIEAEVKRLEAADVDALVVILLTYAPSQLALPALSRTRLPFLVWNTQELWSVDSTFSIQDMIDNHGVHGTQDLCSVLVRSGIGFEYVTGHLQDATGLSKLADFAYAAAGVRRLKSMRVGLLGHPFPGMGDFAVDTTHLAASLGASPVHLAIQDYIRISAAAPDHDVASLAQLYRDSCEIAADVNAHDLECAARAELALRHMLNTHQLDAFSYQFLAFGEDARVSTVPFVGASRLMAEGIGFAGEGDLLGAAAIAFFNQVQTPATFSEIFTIDFAGNALFMSHMGEANAAMARRDRPIPLVARPAPIVPTKDRQLALVVSLQPGPATLAALTMGPKQRWRIIAAPVEIQDFGPLPGVYVPHFKVAPRRDVRDFLTSYAKAGGPHHNAIIRGHAQDRLRLAASILKADYIEI